MTLDKNQKINLVLGIGVIITLVLGVFLLGFSINSNSYGSPKTTSQSILVYSPELKSQISDSSSNLNKVTPNLGQTLKEQQYQNPSTTTNNIKIDIHNTGYYGFSKTYYHGYNYNNHNYNQYYNGYYPYKNHGFYYTNSYGVTHKYSYW